jgi:S-adenosylmethionine decarboxylase
MYNSVRVRLFQFANQNQAGEATSSTRAHFGRFTLELFGFGSHLMIDGHHAEKSKLEDIDFIRGLLEQLPLDMDMHKIMPVHVKTVVGSHPEDAGITGVVIVAESHIAIQTFPEKRFVSVDVFSCKEFDTQKAISSLVEAFQIGRFETHLINRGKEFPHDMPSIERILAGDRSYLEARIS